MDRYRELKHVFRQLRKKCPWDRKQTHLSLLTYLREEVREFTDSVKKRDYPEMCEELGDVLLQVYFHAQIASEKKKFNIDDVYDVLIRKLKRRHPHVFGKTKANSVGEVIFHWKRIKDAEKRRKKGMRRRNRSKRSSRKSK